MVGLPNGTRWASRLDVLFRDENSIIASQIGKAIDKVKDRCLVGVNT